MAVPAKIKVGPLPYAVEVIEGLNGDENQPLNGSIKYAALSIKLAHDLAAPTQRVCLLHEILHAIYEMSGHEAFIGDEDLITATSYGIYQVLRDNPELVRYLTEEL